MRVLHVNSGNLYGGIEVLLVTLARHRDVCPMLEPEFALCFPGRTQQELAGTGAAVHVLGPTRVSRPWTVWRARRRLRALLREGHFDVVICHGSWSLSLFASEVRKTGVPLVMWLHSPPAVPLNWLDRWASWNEPDLTICNSQYTLAGLHHLFPSGRRTRIYCPVSVPDRINFPEKIRVTRARFDAADDAVIILQIGRWEAWKGHACLMEALSLLADLPGWVNWQVGGVQTPKEVDYLRSIQQAAQDHGIADRVRFLGFLDNRTDLLDVMAAADIYCQPNVAHEPFGITFIEALQARLPVVATPLGGPKEIVDDTCGFLVPPVDSQALADKLRCLIGDPKLRQKLGNNGPARALAMSDPKTRLQELADTLENELLRCGAEIAASDLVTPV